MRVVILVGLLAAFQTAFAQGDTSSVRKWSYEVFYAPNVSYRIITNVGDEEWILDKRKETEVPRMGFSLKVGMIRSINARLSIGTGLSFSSMGFKTKTTELTWAVADVNLPTEIRNSSRYTYLAIPLLAYYKLKVKEKWSADLIVGGSFNIYQNKNVVTQVRTNGKWTSYPDKGFRYNFINLFAMAGIGGAYQINYHWMLKSNFTLNQSFIATNTHAEIKEYLNFLEIGVGVNYRFRKKSN